MGFAANRKPHPESFRCVNLYTRGLWITRQKMVRQVHAKRFRSFDGMLPRQGVHSIFHGIGWQDLLVVSLAMRRIEVSFEADAEGQFLDVMPAVALREPQQAHALFAVVIFAKADRHRSAPAIR